MGTLPDAVQARAEGWRALVALHGRIETALEDVLTERHDLSVVEFTVMDALSCQDGCHLRMQQLAHAAALSPSAATRLVTRLEERGLLRRVLCSDDRRGIYSELTPAGRRLLAKARPTHDTALETVLDSAGETPELAGLVDALQRIPALR